MYLKTTADFQFYALLHKCKLCVVVLKFLSFLKSCQNSILFIDLDFPHIELIMNTGWPRIRVLKANSHKLATSKPVSKIQKTIKSLLQAMWLLSNHPRQLKLELDYLKTAFCNWNNGYPYDLIIRWFREFWTELKRNPNLLVVKSRLIYDEIIGPNGQQLFEFPTAAKRFSSNDHALPDAAAMDLGLNMDANHTSLDLMQLDTPAVRMDTFNAGGVTAQFGVVMADDVLDVPSDMPQTGISEVDLRRKKIMIVTFVPGIGDKLRKIANRFGLQTGFTFPGNLASQFTQHRGCVHASKIRNCVYCVQCSCGMEYIRETVRNHKVHLAEHLKHSLGSALSSHFQQNLDHQPAMHDTTILAYERHSLKRKILETLCIENKAARICNTGVSIEVPAVWTTCTCGMGR